MTRDYMIGSGYHSGSKSPIDVAAFSRVWLENNIRYCDPAPKKTVIIGDTPYASNELTKEFQCIYLHGNLGHVRDKKPGQLLGGWSGTMLALAMVAYCDQLDFIYKEQDCLAFGPWVNQLYADAGPEGQMVFGLPLKVYPNITSTQSLFLIKHEFIPVFVQQYLSLGEDGNQKNNFPENKFTEIENLHPRKMKRMSFGVDRDRPIPYESKGAWYAQQWNTEEFNKAKEYGLL